MKTRNKGKVHPFTSSSSNTQNKDTLFLLNLLPAAIFSLVSVLSPGESEVLAYMMRRSVESFTPGEEKKKKNSKKQSFEGHGHKYPVLFYCDCFYCYTSFWFRWDSSPNRELIHQAIEAFEDHLGNEEKLKKNGGSGRNRRREKSVRRKSETLVGEDGGESVTDLTAGVALENQEILADVAAKAEEEVALPPAMAATAVHGHKGLTRKVLPDVIGLFNSRLWNLWNLNM